MSYNQYDQLVQAASVNYEVSVPLIKAVIMTESSFNPNAYRPEPAIKDGSYGLMQVLFRTAVGLGFPNDPARANELFNPDTNVNLGVKLLSQLQKRYSNVDEIYAAYNAGVARRNDAGQFVNSKGDTGVQKRVDRFLGIYAGFLKEWEDVAAAIVEEEGERSGEAEPAAIAGIALVVLAAYVAYKYFA